MQFTEALRQAIFRHGYETLFGGAEPKCVSILGDYKAFDEKPA